MLLLEPWELFYNISGIMYLKYIDSIPGHTWYSACNQTRSPETHPIRYLNWIARIKCFEIEEYLSKTLSTYNLIGKQFSS